MLTIGFPILGSIKMPFFGASSHLSLFIILVLVDMRLVFILFELFFYQFFFIQNFNIIVIFKWRLFIYLFFIFRFANWYMVCWISNIVIYVFPLFFPSRYIYLVCNWFIFIYFLGSLSWYLAIFFKYLTHPLIYHIASCFSSTLYKSKIIKFYIIKRSILVPSPFGFKFTRDPS